MQQVDVHWFFARAFISGGEASEPALTTSVCKANLCRFSWRHCNWHIFLVLNFSCTLLFFPPRHCIHLSVILEYYAVVNWMISGWYNLFLNSWNCFQFNSWFNKKKETNYHIKSRMNMGLQLTPEVKCYVLIVFSCAKCCLLLIIQ